MHGVLFSMQATMPEPQIRRCSLIFHLKTFGNSRKKSSKIIIHQLCSPNFQVFSIWFSLHNYPVKLTFREKPPRQALYGVHGNSPSMGGAPARPPTGDGVYVLIWDDICICRIMSVYHMIWYHIWYHNIWYHYIYIYTYMCDYIYILIIQYILAVPGPGTTYDGVGGWGGMLTFMWTCRSSWLYAHAGWGGGGGGGGVGC